MPDLFLDENGIKDSYSQDVMDSIIEILAKENIKILAFPHWMHFISSEDREHLSTNSIELLDGYILRLVSLLDTTRKLIAIMDMKPHKCEIGIWGADNPIGKLWVKLMAPNTNFLSLGGHNLGVLERLRSELLYDTGLACQILKTPEECLREKDISIISGPMGKDEYKLDIPMKPRSIRINSWDPPMDFDAPAANKKSGIRIDSGWPIPPIGTTIISQLGVWDMITLVESTLFIENGEFRKNFPRHIFNLRNIENLAAIIQEANITFDGMVSGAKFMSYNDFRKMFFTT